MGMRNVILGTVAGLVLGTAGALAYSHYLGDGSLVADLQAKLDAANADLAAAQKDKQKLSQLSSENTGVSEQIDALSATNDDLRKQIDALKSAPVASPAPQINPMMLAGMMMGMMRGGGGPFQAQQRLFVMQSRLKLTPDQSTAIKTAMDADNKARRDLMRQRFQNGGKVDPAAAAAADTLDKTLATVLSPEQQTEYQQLQSDEQAARAETSATAQIDNVMPLLQLTDAQKQQAMDALYQVQMSAPDPNSLAASPDPMSAITAQVQSTQAALAKVLTPDQMTLYSQEAQQTTQAMAAFRNGRGGPGGSNGGGNNSGGGNGGGAPPNPNGTAPMATTTAGTANPGTDGTSAPATTPAAASTADTAAAASTTATPSTTTSLPITNADGSVTEPAATTNAAPAQ